MVTVTTIRRMRLAPVQIAFGSVAIIVLIIMAIRNYFGKPLDWQSYDLWHHRDKELLRLGGAVVDMEFVRRVGVPDYRIGDFTDTRIAQMNMTELMAHYHSYLDNIDTLCSRKVRMGYLGYGGWEVCDDEGVRPTKHKCLVYSFTTNDDLSFEEDAQRVYDCEVHNFNPELAGEDFNKSRNIQVHTYSIGRNSEITESGKELYTFADIQTILHHEGRVLDVLKINTYGAEWPSLSAMAQFDELDKVKQLLVQFHLGFTREGENDDRARRAVRVLRDLSRAGFRKFYATKQHRGAFHLPGFPVMRPKIYEVHFLNPRFLKDMGLKADLHSKN